MHAEIEKRRSELIALCRRYGVARLEVFGSASRATDFDPTMSDVDLLVEFEPAKQGLAPYLDFTDAVEPLFGRPVDLVERGAIETSRNYIRRRAILKEAETVYG